MLNTHAEYLYEANLAIENEESTHEHNEMGDLSTAHHIKVFDYDKIYRIFTVMNNC